MILGQEPSPSLEELLEHSGVKGMKWGVRKKRVTSTDIRNARIERNVRGNDLNRATINLNSASASGSKGQVTKAVKAYEKALNDYNFSDAHVNANRFTNGEKAALILLTGPLAAVPIGAMALQRKSIQKKQAQLKT